MTSIPHQAYRASTQGATLAACSIFSFCAGYGKKNNRVLTAARTLLAFSGRSGSCKPGCITFWSGRRDLNPRLQPWQGCTLPLSYSRGMEAASRFELEMEVLQTSALPLGHAAAKNRYSYSPPDAAWQAREGNSCAFPFRHASKTDKTGRNIHGAGDGI